MLLIVVLLITGCSFNEKSLDNAKIYTTIYPVEFIVKYLYEDHSTVESIYPVGVNINKYKLTDKQIDEYANGDLFVYVGVLEKKITKSFIEKNKKLLIIDATRGISNDHVEALWLAPNNFLMLAKNIRSSLNEYLDNKVIEDEINQKYDELYKEVSWVDAELRSIAKEALENNNNTLVIENNTFDYLEKYGFNIVSIENIENSKSDNAINDLKNKFKNGTYKNLIKIKNSKSSDLSKSIQDTSGISIIEFSDLITNEDNASDYISIQYENIAKIRELLLK